MEQLFWIESAGFNQHYSAAYPYGNSVVLDKVKTKRYKNSYNRLFGDFTTIPSTSKQEIESMAKPICGLEIQYESLPVSIPFCHLFVNDGKELIIFSIHMAGLTATSRTCSEFENLHNRLMTGYFHVNRYLPQLPQNRKRFSSVYEIENYRQEFETYLFQVCRIKVVAESDFVQDFLSAAKAYGNVDGGNEINTREGCIKVSEAIWVHIPTVGKNQVDEKEEKQLKIDLRRGVRKEDNKHGLLTTRPSKSLITL